MTGYLCSARIYEWEGMVFEFNPYTNGPWPLRKDGKLYKRAGEKWWEFIQPFLDLPREERETYRISGGCIQVGDAE